jgi:hypothetical protein
MEAGGAHKPSSKARRWGTIGGIVVGAFVLGIVIHSFHLRSPIAPKSSGSAHARPRPAEFLFLDNARVAAYLAQLDGGIAKSERLSETLSTEENANVSGELFHVGASAQHENFVERQVTPTAAASFFRLTAALIGRSQLQDVSVDNLDDFKGIDEGTFVRFTSNDLRTPIYANSYLVVRQAGTLKALFSTFKASGERKVAIRAQREEARSYAHQVGPNPRIVFALTPRADESIQFLLPVHYRQLSDERSLIKDGGGRFTVVGKVVRVFRTARRKGKTAYVDSPTLETWKKPLERVPVLLLRRSSSKCGATALSRSTDAGGEEATLRSCVLDRLQEQTRIPSTGAVILPIAVYK